MTQDMKKEILDPPNLHSSADSTLSSLCFAKGSLFGQYQTDYAMVHQIHDAIHANNDFLIQRSSNQAVALLSCKFSIGRFFTAAALVANRNMRGTLASLSSNAIRHWQERQPS